MLSGSDEMNIYEIRDKAFSIGKCVLSTADIANIIVKDKKTAAVYAKRMVDKGLAHRVIEGYITITDNDFVIANQLFQPSYISLHSALYLHKLNLQIPAKITLLSTKNTKKIGDYIYHKISPKYFFGFRNTTIGRCSVLLAYPEKAVLDGLYLGELSGQEIVEIMKKLDIKKMEEFALKMNKAVVHRIGYLMDIAGIKHSLKPSGKKRYKLCKKLPARGEINKKWGIIVNEVIKC